MAQNSDTKKLIIGIAGFAGAGKDEVRKILVRQHGYHGAAFADALRNMAMHLDPYFPQVEKTYSELVYESSYDSAKRNYPFIRDFLVKLGHGMRQYVNDNVWISALLPIIEAHPKVVISDVRYSNEANWIHEHGGIVIRITRPGVGPANDTEAWSIPALNPDYVIHNDSTLENLASKVQDLLIKL